MKSIFTLFALLCSGLLLPAQTTLMGRITDENGNGLPYASVILYKNDIYQTGMETDSLGWYFFQNDPMQNAGLEPGSYDVQVSYLGYLPEKKKELKVHAQSTNYQNFALVYTSLSLDMVTVTDYQVPLISSEICYCGCLRKPDEEEAAAPQPTAKKPASLRIFPNPATTQATVNLSTPAQQLTLLNLNGQPLRSWAHLEAGPLTFSVSQLPSGNYVLVAETAEGRRFGKLLVNR